MTDPIIIKILWGLVAVSIMGIFITVIAHLVADRIRNVSNNKPSNRLLLGSAIFVFIVVVWYIGLIWYWLTLLAQV